MLQDDDQQSVVSDASTDVTQSRSLAGIMALGKESKRLGAGGSGGKMETRVVGRMNATPDVIQTYIDVVGSDRVSAAGEIKKRVYKAGMGPSLKGSLIAESMGPAFAEAGITFDQVRGLEVADLASNILDQTRQKDGKYRVGAKVLGFTTIKKLLTGGNYKSLSEEEKRAITKIARHPLFSYMIFYTRMRSARDRLQKFIDNKEFEVDYYRTQKTNKKKVMVNKALDEMVAGTYKNRPTTIEQARANLKAGFDKAIEYMLPKMTKATRLAYNDAFNTLYANMQRGGQ